MNSNPDHEAPQDTAGRPPANPAWARRWRIRNTVITGLIDLALIVSGMLFDFAFVFVFPPTAAVVIPLMIAVLVLRRVPRFMHSRIVAAVYFLFVLLTLDVMVLMNGMIYGWRPILVLAAPLSYVAALRFRSNGLVRLSKTQALIVPYLLTFLLSTAGDSPSSPRDCAAISRQPGVRLMWNFNSRHKLRFIEKLDGSRFMITYRKSFSLSAGSPPALELIDTAGRSSQVIMKSGEVIGLYNNPRDGRIYTVIVDAHAEGKPGVSYMDLAIFDRRGRLLRRIPMPNGRSDFYAANFFPYYGKLLVIVESNSYLYDPADGTVRIKDMPESELTYSMVQQGRYLYGVAAKSPLFLLTEPDSVIKIDLKDYRIVKKRYGGPYGYYEIKKFGDTGRFVAAYYMIGGGNILDTSLNTVRRLDIPRGARNFALDKSGAYLFAPNFFSGRMRVLDVARNKLLPGEFFVGKGTRAMTGEGGGKTIISNSCGLVEIDHETVIRNAARAAGP